MSIERRVRKLEGPTLTGDGENLEHIFIVGIEAVVTEDGCESPASQVKVSASTEEPQNFHAYCLHPNCEAREHAKRDDETLEQMQSRLTREHKGLVA
ncbi:hypothetical protein [Sulfitobacter sp.]|uniref:hypothetical protein n=1 Tax=Sulfitobacter sp. TaxID=1903071 RepID=UPI002626F6EF|nr:hypothetical protein [Sulfitobacter sp.]|tara:strand:- start:869 stop:1159 length:291 start_codon:yes stop_codon:yes gene_type:complete